MERLTQMSLFTGCGGIDLAFERQGFDSLLQCDLFDASHLTDADLGEPCEKTHTQLVKEQEVVVPHETVARWKRAQATAAGREIKAVLEKHWPKIERVNDVRNVRKITTPENEQRGGDLERNGRSADTEQVRSGRVKGTGTGDRRLRRETKRNPTVIHFGSPCQDLSIAGKQRGFDGERSGLFTEAIRILDEFDPDFALWENVDGAFSASGGRDFQAAISKLIGADVPMPRSGKWARSGLVRRAGREVAWRTFDAQFFGVAQRRTRVFALVDLRGHRAGEILFEPEGVRGHLAPSETPREELAASLRSRAAGSSKTMPGRGGEDDSNLVVHTVKLANTHANGGNVAEDIAYTLDGSANQAVTTSDVQPVANLVGAHHDRYDLDNENYVPDIAQPVTGRQRNKGVESETYVPDIAYAVSNREAKGVPLSGRQVSMVGNNLGVRRLTPRECERLQGMPDDWTLYRPDGSEISDSQRYKMIGNSVAVPNLEWIAARIAEVASR